MKFIIFLFAIFALSASAASVKRKVSSSDNYYCLIERDGGDRNDYQREYRFPFPAGEGETYELKGSLRFNKYSLVFTQGAPVTLSFSEYIDHTVVTETQSKALEASALRTTLELKKGQKVITYNVTCHAE
ncbi:MAG: hypothetical protein ACJ76H_06085 [Bacteriovoracaceae bacterium]